MANSIQYHICPTRPETHLLDVTCIINQPDPAGQKVALPAWIPGSYLIRDFSRHMISLKAESAGKNIPVRMLDKNTWQCGPTSTKAPLKLSYQVYAYDLTPRGAHVDNTHAFFNGSRVFLKIVGYEEVTCSLEIILPPDPQYKHWKIATSLPKDKENEKHNPDRIYYKAENYDDLIDHPVEMGEYSVHTFEAGGIPHELVIRGKHNGDVERLCSDLSRICTQHIQFFATPAPMERYLFLVTVLGDGYGGLEHRSSSAIQCRRDSLPKVNDPSISEGYRNLLGLFSHEYFHTWNVKRIKPKAFTPYNLEKENYTRQLWIFEGITSYYDELALVRSSIINRDSFLELLSKTLTRHYLTPGRFKQTLEQSSFEAWTKFYNPDENSPNATISYYVKGAVVALALDLLLRQETEQRISLETIMQVLWQRYGLTNQGLPEDGFEAIVEEISGCTLKPFFDQALRSTAELDLTSLFADIGIQLTLMPIATMDDLGNKKPIDAYPLEKSEKPVLEIKLKANGTDAQVVYVMEGSTAEAAGIAPGDVLIAINDLKVDRARFESMIANYSIGDVVVIHAFRRDELMTFKVKLTGSTLKTATLSISPSITNEQRQRLDAWLGSI